MYCATLSLSTYWIIRWIRNNIIGSTHRHHDRIKTDRAHPARLYIVAAAVYNVYLYMYWMANRLFSSNDFTQPPGSAPSS